MPASDVIIVGLGAMGSAAAYQLSQAGISVLGLDRFTPPHAYGSSHGQTRIIREAYFEHPSYVPLVQRAYTLWEELERRAGRQLFVSTGGLMIGPKTGVVFNGAKRSAEQHGLAHRILTSEEVRWQFPALRPDDDMAAVWEPRAGCLFPETCVDAHLTLARRQGAELRFGETVQSWRADGAGVRVVTDRGDYLGGTLVISAGAWAGELLSELRLPLEVERQVLFWFEPTSHRALFEPERLPIYLWEYDDGRFFYGFPDLGEGVKVAGHHDGRKTTPQELDRTVRPEDEERLREVLNRFMPLAAGQLRSSVVCMYTNTPDGHFIIDRHPEHPQVWIVSPCSGHGFKFSSSIGEVVKDLTLTGKSSLDLSLFRLNRSWR